MTYFGVIVVDTFFFDNNSSWWHDRKVKYQFEVEAMSQMKQELEERNHEVTKL